MKGAAILLGIGALLLAVVLSTLAGTRWAQGEAQRRGGERAPLEAATVEERLGGKVPLDLHFVDTEGRRARLGSFVGALEPPADAVPTLLVLAYFNCRTLCNLVLQGTARTLAELGARAGVDYRVVTVSIDPRDAPEDARVKQAEVTALLRGGISGAAVASSGSPWTFLVGGEGEIRELAESLGFGYRYDATTDQFSHPAVIFALTPAGGISSYIYGIEPEVAEVGGALREAAAGGTRTTLQRILLRCYHYVPALRRYAGAVRWGLRAGGALTLIGFGTLLVRLIRRVQRREVAA